MLVSVLIFRSSSSSCRHPLNIFVVVVINASNLIIVSCSPRQLGGAFNLQLCQCSNRSSEVRNLIEFVVSDSPRFSFRSWQPRKLSRVDNVLSSGNFLWEFHGMFTHIFSSVVCGGKKFEDFMRLKFSNFEDVGCCKIPEKFSDGRTRTFNWKIQLSTRG